MQHILFGSDTSEIKVAILIKSSSLNKVKIRNYYINPLTELRADNFIAFDLFYNNKNKCPAAEAKEYLIDLLPEIEGVGADIILVCDPTYFKYLTGNSKTDPHYGYLCPCTVKGYEHLQVVICPNYSAMMYDPSLQSKVDRALDVIRTAMKDSYVDPGMDVIRHAYYPETHKDIKDTLQDLKKHPALTCDIEALGLVFHTCGISTIAFAWNKHEGVAFGVDRGVSENPAWPLNEDHNFSYRPDLEIQGIRSLLLDFLLTYKGKLIYHNIGYDGKVLVYNLFMKNLSDYKGMIQGIKCVTADFDDTKLIAYQATNNAVQNKLGLKELSAPYTGNYAQEDIKDVSKIPLPELLEYNLIDAMATWYVKEKYEPIMIEDEQQPLYEGELKRSVKTLMYTELCGMPINPEKVQIAKKQLVDIIADCNHYFETSDIIKIFHMGELINIAETMTAKAKKKVYSVDDEIVARNVFNPGSDNQLRRLLYDYLLYPVIDLTKGKQPSTSGKTLKKLRAHAKSQLKEMVGPTVEAAELLSHIDLFNWLKKYADASIILSTFIPVFEKAVQLSDGSWRIYGNFNLGGTQSLRLSSSNPEK